MLFGKLKKFPYKGLLPFERFPFYDYELYYTDFQYVPGTLVISHTNRVNIAIQWISLAVQISCNIIEEIIDPHLPPSTFLYMY